MDDNVVHLEPCKAYNSTDAQTLLPLRQGQVWHPRKDISQIGNLARLFLGGKVDDASRDLAECDDDGDDCGSAFSQRKRAFLVVRKTYR